MKLWKWFVGQVTRLRGSIVGVGAPDADQRGRADDHFDVAGEPAGPPEHWVERVRRGAPGLLEPSLRRPGEPPGPPEAERAMPSQTRLEPQASPLERPERDYVPREPPVRPRGSEAPAWPSLLRKALLRKRSVRAAEVDGSPAPEADPIPRELDAATRRPGETAAPHSKPHSRRRSVDETGPTPARPSAPIARRPEPSTGPTEVIEFESAQRLAARAEWTASPDRPIRAGAARQQAESPPRSEPAVDESGAGRGSEPATPSPARKRESEVARLREPAAPRRASQRESAVEPGPSPPRRADPLSAADTHPWPDLPPSLDQVEDDGEATLRAWVHQQRLDHEQTRL